MEPSRRTVRARRWCPVIPVVALGTILAVAVVVAQNDDTYVECKVGEACVRQEQCLNGKINSVGAHILGERNGMSFAYCDKFDMTCCQLPDDDDDSSMEEPAPTATTTEEPEDPGWSAQCGQRTVDASGTDHSNATTRFEFPWSVALFNLKMILGKTIKEFLCGGTLIDDYIVVTAARCVHQRSVDTLRVQLGRWDLHEGVEPRTQEIPVERVISHTSYVPSSHVHNIALLTLANAVTMERAANRICLPDRSINHTTAELCYVTGWRNIPYKNARNPLLKYRVTFQDQKDCTQRIRGATGVPGFRLPKENICPDYVDDVPTCSRAPGSALICTLDSSEPQYFLVGIASYDLRGCSKSKTPEVFLETSNYVRWIDEHLVEQGREPSYSRPDPLHSSE
uniref:Peptidase S1 domain-containing protein n=1 Tax=Anopheles dirus TaxID=7168 RepID=A0A182N3I0_9DIPT